ncbi:hypothetical protein Poly24_02270 [Rosistilla carotiformis]|uniref:Glycosyl hydrolases family 2, sugar binding domain n=1 Tax=Rosistilla carotiformis TaxID=2528017 RepID=A0A518JLW4_9BACT|nr:hypothetical protein [Rosistilla carotiformis]QDV66540.1 hypothetical protein Poly24_02270 [Rosistilla carotiformis]
MPANQPHTIRLRGPWKLTPLEAPNAQPLPGQIGQSWDRFIEGYAGPVLYVRHFNRPTGLSTEDRVELAITDCVGTAHVSLNETPLANFAAEQTPFRIDITAHLQLSNQLAIEIIPPALPCPAGITGDVQLEIHSGEGSAH